MNIEIIKIIFQKYIIFLGIFLICTSLVEYFAPKVSYGLWEKWVRSKFFPFHGIILMAGGFPLTQFRDSISGILMLLIGIIVVFTGPFILIFPDKMRELFLKTMNDMDQVERYRMVKIDSITRLSLGIFFIVKILFWI